MWVWVWVMACASLYVCEHVYRHFVCVPAYESAWSLLSTAAFKSLSSLSEQHMRLQPHMRFSLFVPAVVSLCTYRSRAHTHTDTDTHTDTHRHTQTDTCTHMCSPTNRSQHTHSRTPPHLHSQLRRLLSLARQLSTDNERKRNEIRAELAKELTAREGRLSQV